MPIPEIIKEKATQIRHEIYGQQVRESLASGIEFSGELSDEANERSKLAKEVAEIIEEKYRQQILAQDLNPNKDPELVDLRNGNATAGERLNAFETAATQQLVAAQENIQNISVIVPPSNGVDDTDVIQNCIDLVSEKGGGTVLVPKGHYWVRGHVSNYHQNYLRDLGGIELKDNVYLRMDNGTYLNTIPNGERQYVVLRIYNKENVMVTGGNIVGERYEHVGTAGEWGYGVAITGGRDHVIRDMKLYNFWGDGINLQAHRSIEDGAVVNVITVPTNITIENIRSSNNLRQGMSIEAGRFVFVKNCVFEGTIGKLPESGVDIEPWDPNHPAEYITFENCVFENNNGNDLLITRAGTRHVKVINCTFAGGTTNEPINIEGSVIDILIQGASFIKSKRIKIRGAKDVLVSQCLFSGPALQVLDSENVTMKDCSAIGDGTNKTQPIISLADFIGGNTHNKNIQIIDCILQGFLNMSNPTQDHQANIIAIERATNLVIRGCSIENGANGINFVVPGALTGAVAIEDCEFYNIASRNIKDPRNSHIARNKFYGGNFYGLAQSVIYNEYQEKNFIRDNVLYRDKISDKQLFTPKFTGPFVSVTEQIGSSIGNNIAMG